MKKLVLFLILFSFILLSGCTDNVTKIENDEKNNEISSIESSNDTLETSSELSIDSVVEAFNKTSNTKLVFVEEFSVLDKESTHYRTEFRTRGFANSLGKSYSYDNNVMDIIFLNSLYGEPNIRVYVNLSTFDDCINIIRNISPILDKSMDEKTLSDAIKYVSDNKAANGYYYGQLGLLLSKNNSGYEMMIKTD